MIIIGKFSAAKYLAWCGTALIGVAGHFGSASGQIVFSGTGAAAGDIQAVLDAFRASLGVNNGVGPSATPGVGRREINWDGVPDDFASPNAFPGDFFNQPDGSPAGRIRGAQFSTSGTLEVSADSDSNNDGNPGPVEPLFGNRHPDNDDDFGAFSPQRIFGLVGANQLDVSFSVPGSPSDSASVRGFGAIFTDVETAGVTKLDFYGTAGNLLGSYIVPAFPFSGGDSYKSFSFLGVTFADPDVTRVRITNGDYDLNLTSFGGLDATAMDDFIYGEPVAIPAVPEAGHALALLGFGCAALLGLRRRCES